MPGGFKQINYAQLGIETAGKPTLAELEAFLRLARAAEVPDETRVVLAESHLLRAEAIVNITSWEI